MRFYCVQAVGCCDAHVAVPVCSWKPSQRLLRPKVWTQRPPLVPQLQRRSAVLRWPRKSSPTLRKPCKSRSVRLTVPFACKQWKSDGCLCFMRLRAVTRLKVQNTRSVIARPLPLRRYFACVFSAAPALSDLVSTDALTAGSIQSPLDVAATTQAWTLRIQSMMVLAVFAVQDDIESKARMLFDGADWYRTGYLTKAQFQQCVHQALSGAEQLLPTHAARMSPAAAERCA